MQWIKRVLSTVGGLAVAAMLLAIVAPKSAHALVATLVQIVPGSTTHVGQNESNLVALDCYPTGGDCFEEDPSTGGDVSSTPYTVPTGYTFVVTDYSWSLTGQTKGAYSCDNLAAESGQNFPPPPYNPYYSSRTCAIADTTGYAASNAHFTTGLRFASGTSLADSQIMSLSNAGGLASVQGYLVPN